MGYIGWNLSAPGHADGLVCGLADIPALTWRSSACPQVKVRPSTPPVSRWRRGERPVPPEAPPIRGRKLVTQKRPLTGSPGCHSCQTVQVFPSRKIHCICPR